MKLNKLYVCFVAPVGRHFSPVFSVYVLNKKGPKITFQHHRITYKTQKQKRERQSVTDKSRCAVNTSALLSDAEPPVPTESHFV